MVVFSDIQKRFLSDLKSKIPQNMSFAEVLADDLKISIDSAYRRIRDDTNLSFEELRILCSKYRISLDSYFFTSSDFVKFNYRAINHSDFTFEKYVQSLLYNLKTIQHYEANELIYTAKDIPLFYIFRYPSLTAFKIYFWNKSYFSNLASDGQLFDENLMSENLQNLIQEVSEKYKEIDSTEIWGDETINISIKQIEHEYHNNNFNSKDQALELCEELRGIVQHLKEQVEMQTNQDSVNDDENLKNFTFYYNRLIITDNTVFYKMGDLKLVHLGHNILNILSTADPAFCSHTYEILQNIIRNSICLTDANSENREMFFDEMMGKVDVLVKKIKSVE